MGKRTRKPTAFVRTPSNLIKDAWVSVAQCLALSFPALIFWGNSDDCSVRVSNESEPALRSCTGRSRERPLGKAPGIPTTILPAPDQSELKMPGFHRGSSLRQNNNPSLTLVVNVVNRISTKDNSQRGKNIQYTVSNSGGKTACKMVGALWLPPELTQRITRMWRACSNT